MSNNRSNNAQPKGNWGGSNKQKQVNPLSQMQQSSNSSKMEDKTTQEEEMKRETATTEPVQEFPKFTYVPKNKDKEIEPVISKEEAEAIIKSIPGLIYIPNFITLEEQNSIVKELDGTLGSNWFQAGNTESSRRVQQYGYKFRYDTGEVDLQNLVPPIPDILQQLITTRLIDQKLYPTPPDQLIINEYEPGQGIHPHVDKKHIFDEHVASISLLSPVVMVFRNNKSYEKKFVWLEPLSLVVLTGNSRYGWTHGIDYKTIDIVKGKEYARSRRISLTFRNMLQEYLSEMSK